MRSGSCGASQLQETAAAPAPQVPDGELWDGPSEQEAALSAIGQGQALGAEQRKGEASWGAGTGGRALWTPGQSAPEGAGHARALGQPAYWEQGGRSAERLRGEPVGAWHLL